MAQELLFMVVMMETNQLPGIIQVEIGLLLEEEFLQQVMRELIAL